MTRKTFLSRTDYQAEVDAHFKAVLNAAGFNDDGTPMTDPTESGNPAVGHRGDSRIMPGDSVGRSSAILPGQLEFFSVKRTSCGLVFEMHITEK